MRAGGGKQKGSKFERQVCKDLSLWITNGQREDCLWRSAISGGRATVASRKGKSVRQGGDICAVSPEGHGLADRFFMECKFVKDLNLAEFLIKGTGLLAQFWKKARTEAIRDKKIPMIIAKQNNFPPLVILPANHQKQQCNLRVDPVIQHSNCDICYYSELLRSKFLSDDGDGISLICAQ
jgi:hypothetical protein